MNRVIVSLVGFLAVGAAVADENDFRCLKSVGLEKPIRMQFVFRAERDGVGYVKYESGSGLIQVKRIREKELRILPGRPSEVEATWQEVIQNRTGGTYVLVSQGALMNEFRYIRKDGKTFEFEEDLNASTEEGCEWFVK